MSAKDRNGIPITVGCTVRVRLPPPNEPPNSSDVYLNPDMRQAEGRLYTVQLVKSSFGVPVVTFKDTESRIGNRRASFWCWSAAWVEVVGCLTAVVREYRRGEQPTSNPAGKT